MNQRLRVLFAIGSLGAGGSERQLIGILRYLDRTRFEPQLYLLNRDGEFLNEIPTDVPVTAFSDEPPPRLYLPGRIHHRQVGHLTSVLLSARIDLLYDRTARMALVTGPAAVRARVPRVSALVADPEYDLRENFPRFHRLKQRLLRRSMDSADRVLANSESLRQAALQFFHLPEERTATVWNGFDFEQIQQLAEQTVPEAVAPEGGSHFEILTVGRLCAVKGFADLIEAVRILVQERNQSGLRLSIAGDGPDRHRLEQQVTARRLGMHVRLTGFARNPYALMRRADLFCLTSYYEGCPNVLVEAMACGVPVVATDCPHGPREILEGDRLGSLVPVAAPECLADAIQDAMERRNFFRERARQAAESVRQRFPIRETVRNLERQLEIVSAANSQSF